MDAEDDVDECGDVGDVDLAVAVHIAGGFVLRDNTQNHVNQGRHIAHIHFAIAVHIAREHSLVTHIVAGFESHRIERRQCHQASQQKRSYFFHTEFYLGY